MIPGIDPRQMKLMMKRMGINQTDIDATQVIIRTKTHDIIINSPSVQKINMPGQTNYQISGSESIKKLDSNPDIDEDDIQTVIDQTNASREKVIELIRKNKGDLAQTIIELSE